MGWVHPEIMCMMHPDEKNHPGVCSSCLREKLKKLPGLPFSMDPPNSWSSPTRYSSCSSASSSVCLSPTSYNNNHHPGRHRRVSSNVVTVGEKGVFVISGGGGGGGRMGKSRSVAASVKRKRVRNNVVAGSRKKEGFWSKLIRSTSMKTRCVFVQSKHAKE